MDSVRRWLLKWWRATGGSGPDDPRRLNYVMAMNWQAKLSILAVLMIPASLNGWFVGLSTTQAILGGVGAIAVGVVHYLVSVLPARRRLRRIGLEPDEF